MVLDVEIEKYLITTGRAEYKYAILHGGDGKQSLEFEFVPKKSNANVVNRELRIPSNQMSQCTGNNFCSLWNERSIGMAFL